MPADEAARLSHLLIKDKSRTERYVSPRSGRNPPINVPPRNRQQHADSLITELVQIEQKMPDAVREQRAIGFDGVAGIYISFESEPEFGLKFESLEFTPSGIELCSVKQPASEPSTSKTIATVFVPDGKLSYFIGKIEDYRDKNTPSGKPRNKELVDSISHIKIAALEGLWTDANELFPEPGEPIWWEVWLRKSDQTDYENFFRAHAQHFGLSVSAESIRFLDRTVVLVHGTPEQMSQSIHVLASFAELRKAKDTAAFFTGMGRPEQQEWIDDALRRLEGPDSTAPAVCVLDTGVNQLHPLLAPIASSADMHTYNPAWGTDDRYGHGTPMAGLAIYGDLTDTLASREPIRLSHCLESVKVTPDPAFHNDQNLYGAITRESIARAELNPDRKRVFCMALTATDGRDHGRPSSWSATVDAIASGYEDDQRRLIIISGGNTDQTQRHLYPESNQTDPIHDPGQAWNALTIGAYTEKSVLDATQYPGWIPVAPFGDLSPASCTAMQWGKNGWPIKPEIVLEGGNMALSPVDGSADYIDDGLQLLTTGHQFALGKKLVSFGDTSAATALASRLAAMLQAQYPEFWPETIRALLIHSAQWTEAMKSRFAPLSTQEEYRRILQYCGFGVPDEQALFWSAKDSLTLIAQDALQPFVKEGSQTKTRDINFHRIPWPSEALESLGDAKVEMKVTLSYFVEPNPGERGWSRKYRYQSHGLRFDVKRSLETMESFAQRVNKAARDAEADDRTTVTDTGSWMLGDRLRTLGSVHSDTWRGTAAELASRGHIAIYPVLGWWRERPALERWGNQARYSLIISIRTPGIDTDIYTPVLNQIAVPVET